jgi:hypothetical protein
MAARILFSPIQFFPSKKKSSVKFAFVIQESWTWTEKFSRKKKKRLTSGAVQVELSLLVEGSADAGLADSRFPWEIQMKAITTTIRETIKASNGKGERKDIGKIAFLVPTLEEVKDHLNTETAFIMEKDGEKTLDTYESNFSQFLADAIEAACKVKLFSKLEPKSIAFKAGASLWSTIEELVETSSTRGQHFAIAASFKAAITAFVTGLKKSDGWKSNVLGYLLTAKALAETSTGNKQVVQKVLDGFLATLSDEDVAKYEKILNELGEALAFSGTSLEDEE